MSDDLVMQLSSNSNPSNQSLPTKLAKLEARMVGKSSSSPAMQSGWQPATAPPPPPPPPPPLMTRFPEQEELDDSSSDDDNGEEFLIQHNTQKRCRVEDDDVENGEEFLIQHSTQKRQRVEDDVDEEAIDGRTKVPGTFEIRSSMDDSNRRKPGRGRGRATSSRGRGSKNVDQVRSLSTSSTTLTNGHVEKSLNKEEISELLGKIAFLEEELSRSRQEAAEHQHLNQKLEKELKDIKDRDQQMKTKRVKVISELLISVSKAERQEARMKIRQESLRLGNVGVIRAGTVISESWEDGQALKDLNAHLKSLLETKETIERHRKSLKKRQPEKSDVSDAEIGMSEEDLLIQDEICKSRLASIKREEESYTRERDRYELEKGRLIREMKRVRDEDGSRFNNFQVLNQRYALLNLLGKGGFSEVYKAFDLLEYRYVACKLHGLNAQWSEEKKQSYIRHAIREYNIHKTLVHPNIVRLWDIFEIDHNTFCTVLEYCSGKDLDVALKTTPILPEKEARIIIVQIFHGLIYLNKRPQKIIHYDLKPGNVLFDEVGVAKVTDFGLSKIVEDDVGSQGMELTSQGAGTYWYLPPECFDLTKIPLISSKVDVWSAGVMLYQMLFGRRPFGHDQTQERILREDTIINARRVEFPSKPTVSNEAKEFIRRCLAYNQADRPDVLTISQDPYLSYLKR